MKFGRKPPTPTMRSVRTAFVMEEALNTLGPAPAVSDDYVSAVDKVTSGAWGMMGNDQVGCCTMADSGHALMLRTANVSSIVIPETVDILAAYAAESGWNGVIGDVSDQGADEGQVCAFMETTGLLGHKSSATGAVDPTNQDHLAWCVQIFGDCRLGIYVTQREMDQFNAGQPWDAITQSQPDILGGHDVPIVKYDQTYWYVVTWGKLQAVKRGFPIEEAHSELYMDWIKQAGTSPSGFNLAQLYGDIIAVR